MHPKYEISVSYGWKVRSNANFLKHRHRQTGQKKTNLMPWVPFLRHNKYYQFNVKYDYASFHSEHCHMSSLLSLRCFYLQSDVITSRLHPKDTADQLLLWSVWQVHFQLVNFLAFYLLFVKLFRVSADNACQSIIGTVNLNSTKKKVA